MNIVYINMMSKSGIHDVQNVVENSVKVTILNKNPNPHYQNDLQMWQLRITRQMPKFIGF